MKQFYNFSKLNKDLFACNFPLDFRDFAFTFAFFDWGGADLIVGYGTN
jgi:hypothetical protein